MKQLLALILCSSLIYLAAAKVNDACESEKDCSEGECCVHIHSLTHSKCKLMRREGEFCFPDPNSHLLEDGEGVHKYKYMCPCSPGLNCKAEEVIELDYGVIEYKEATCTAK